MNENVPFSANDKTDNSRRRITITPFIAVVILFLLYRFIIKRTVVDSRFEQPNIPRSRIFRRKNDIYKQTRIIKRSFF